MLEGENVPFPLDTTMTIGFLNTGSRSKDIFIHSPVPFSPELGEEIESRTGGGRIAKIIAPNLQHWIFIDEWSRFAPDAEIWIPQAALGEDVAQKLLHKVPTATPVKVMRVR